MERNMRSSMELIQEVATKNSVLFDHTQFGQVLEGRCSCYWYYCRSSGCCRRMNYLKHKHKEIGLEDLIVRLRIEEDNHGSEKKTGGNSMVAEAHVVEDAPNNKKKRKHSGKGSHQRNSKKNKGFKGKCFNCNKHGHRAANYQSKGKTTEVHMTDEEKLSNEISDINHLVLISEVNLVSNTKEWWVDIGATRHICSDRKMFTTYQLLNQGKQLFMGNSSASKVERQGNVVMKMTYGRELTLNQVLHVPDIRKYLVSRALLSKNGFRLVFETNKFVLIKNGMYARKGYLNNGLFR
ncbi:hypothetical protein L3X38_036516 [Prunus dulcis]|uniref:Retrovirus-related Pol polyprotein from transposon TNT 1-94-like beta-barrel domain-containing protein n=1 Tax=Prunus dulcis TaxID=3755 RepID=A0AAD4YPU4_PRUDU|nr:hypothetical protein L3X38_036516 [Prunus dulcis]